MERWLTSREGISKNRVKILEVMNKPNVITFIVLRHLDIVIHVFLLILILILLWFFSFFFFFLLHLHLHHNVIFLLVIDGQKQKTLYLLNIFQNLHYYYPRDFVGVRM